MKCYFSLKDCTTNKDINTLLSDEGDGDCEKFPASAATAGSPLVWDELDGSRITTDEGGVAGESPMEFIGELTLPPRDIRPAGDRHLVALPAARPVEGFRWR